MMKSIKQAVADLYPDLNDENFLDELVHSSFITEIDQGQVILNYNDDIKSFFILLEGQASIYYDYSSREKEVYQVSPGHLCSYIIMNCLVNSPSDVKAIAKTNIKALVIDKKNVLRWMSSQLCWRILIMKDYQKKYKAVMHHMLTQ